MTPFLFKNLEIQWILEGEGPKRVEEKKRHSENFYYEIERWIEETKTNEPEIEDWFKYEFREKFPKFKEWKRKADKDRENSFIQEANIA